MHAYIHAYIHSYIHTYIPLFQWLNLEHILLPSISSVSHARLMGSLSWGERCKMTRCLREKSAGVASRKELGFRWEKGYTCVRFLFWGLDHWLNIIAVTYFHHFEQWFGHASHTFCSFQPLKFKAFQRKNYQENIEKDAAPWLINRVPKLAHHEVLYSKPEKLDMQDRIKIVINHFSMFLGVTRETIHLYIDFCCTWWGVDHLDEGDIMALPLIDASASTTDWHSRTNIAQTGNASVQGYVELCGFPKGWMPVPFLSIGQTHKHTHAYFWMY